MNHFSSLFLLGLFYGVTLHGASAGVVQNLQSSGAGSLREVVSAATPGDTITFALSLDGGTVDFGGSEIVLGKNLIIDARSLPNGLTLDAGEQSRLFAIWPATVEVGLRGLTLARGRSEGGFDGGAIHNVGALSMEDCELNENTLAFERGGAIFSDGMLMLTNCHFTKNFTTGQGGAIYSMGSLEMNGCVFSCNESSDGGAVLAGSTQEITLTGCRFASNISTHGGALSIGSSSLTLTACEFAGNSGYTGGAIAGGGTTWTFHECSFIWNNASSSGGAISLSSDSTTMTNCLLSRNSASAGGAMYLSSPGQLTMINCTLSGNSDQYGGGAIWNDGTLILKNGIFWGNGTEVGGNPISGGSSHNLIEGDPLAADPMFVDAANGDLRLQFGSPAIGSGDNAANGRPGDLDGEVRVVETIDLGAYESSFPDPTPLSTWAVDHSLSFIGSQPTDDPDGDGRTNFEEFAFGLNPLEPSGAPYMVRGMSQVEGVDYFILSIPTLEGAVFTGSPHPTATISGVTYTIEGSFDLQNFNAPVEFVESVSSVEVPNGWDLTTFRLLGDASVHKRGFLRVRLSQ